MTPDEAQYLQRREQIRESMADLADSYRGLYVKLIDTGFSESQAMAITRSHVFATAFAISKGKVQ